MTEDTETPPEPKPKSPPEHHEALTHEMEARTKLTEARRGFWDRLVMLGLIPVALVLAPVLASYLKSRFDDSDAALKKIEATIGVLDSSVNRLKDFDADRRVRSAEEMARLTAIVERLELLIATQAVRSFVQGYAREALYSEAVRVAKGAGNFALARSQVEDEMVRQLAPVLKVKPDVLRKLVNEAVDDLAKDAQRRAANLPKPVK